MNSIVNFFKDGGVFLYPLALIFVVGVSIAIERYVYLTRETLRNRSLWDDLVPALSAGNFKQVVGLTQNSKASIATILNYGVARVQSARRRDDIEKAMDESLLEVIPRIEKRTHYLSSLANVGLLIGLLGTITGLIGAFSAVATANPAEKASLLAAAISVAMNNTASGLGVAITLLTAHMFLESKTTSLIDSLEIASVKFLNSITERQSEPAHAPAAPPAPAAPTASAPAAPPYVQPLLKTPFHDRARALSQLDSFIPWSGYTTVDVFTNVEQEYFAIRNATTLYDLTPMVKYRIAGPCALAFLNRLMTRDIGKLKVGRVAYCVWCDDAGHLIDDGTVFRLSETEYRLCTAERQLDWLLSSAIGFDGVLIEEITDQIAALAM